MASTDYAVNDLNQYTTVSSIQSAAKDLGGGGIRENVGPQNYGKDSKRRGSKAFRESKLKRCSPNPCSSFLLMMRFKFILPLIFLSVLLPMIGRAAPISVSAGLQIEPVTSFTTVEVWHGLTPKTVHHGVVVDYRMLDSESPITRGGWTECGLVMIGNGDIGEIPVAFRVWTKEPCDLSLKKPSASDSKGTVQLNFSVSPKISLPIQVLNESVVTVRGIRIGRIGNMYE